MSKFFDTIYGGGTGHISICGRNEDGELSVERWVDWPSDRNFVDRYVSVRADEDVYYSVSMFSDEHRVQIDSAAKTKLIWADADICPPELFRVTPSIVVQTSPAHGEDVECAPRAKSGKPCNGHYHVLWVLDKFYPANEAQEVARRVAVAHAEDGCDPGWSMTKILRVPGTTNTKWSPPYTIHEATYNDVQPYTLADMSEAYSDVSERAVVQFSGDMPRLIDESEADFRPLEDYVTGAGLSNLYLNKPRSGESWSERAYRLQMELFRYGLDADEVFSIAWNAACNKYHPRAAGELTQSGVPIPERSDPELTLWTEIQKTLAEFQTEVTPLSNAVQEVRTEKSLSLLSLEERQKVRNNPTFIDHYVEWALSKSPDHAEVYSHSLATMVLSAAYSDRCMVSLRWGLVKPNLWNIMLGDSTRTHKSSAKNLFLRFVHGIEDQDGVKLDIGSDATAEKLVTVLGERDKQVSVLHTDEINGFFLETMTKNYRSGTLEIYTELYDGKVPVVLRATKGSGNQHRADTSFLLLGVGIFDKVAKTLHREQFESGFLLRSTWALADPRPYKPGDSDLVAGDEAEVTTDYQDPVFRKMLSTVMKQRNRYNEDMPLVMHFEPEALKRINKFTEALHIYAAQRQDKTLDGGIDRLRDSVMKLAALLSYHHNLKKIGLFEVLVAISQGELWFRDFQRMLDAVSLTAFGNELDELESFVRTGANGIRTEAVVLRKFQYKMKDYEELITVLTKQGRIRRLGKEGKLEAL